jgi:hypothetical protein
MCFNELHICAVLWKRKRKENLEFVKVGGYGFPRPYDTGACKSRLFCERPLVDTGFGMPVPW